MIFDYIIKHFVGLIIAVVFCYGAILILKDLILNLVSREITEQAVVKERHIGAARGWNYLVTFRGVSKEFTCSVPREIYDNVYLGASGLLTHKGTWFKKFEF